MSQPGGTPNTQPGAAGATGGAQTPPNAPQNPGTGGGVQAPANNQQPDGKNGQGTGDNPQTQPDKQPDGKTAFTRRSIRREERQKLQDQHAADLEKARKQAADEVRAKNGEFEPLYRDLKPQYDTLDAAHRGLQGRFDTLVDLLEQQIEDMTADWPDEVKRLDPAHPDNPRNGKYEIEDRIAYFNTSGALAKRLMEAEQGTTQTAKPPGTPPSVPPPAPPASAQTSTTDADRQKYMEEERKKIEGQVAFA